METQIEQLTKEYHAKAASEVATSSIGQCKAVFANEDAPIDETASNEINELHRVYFIVDDDIQVAKEEDYIPSGVLPCQLPPKELNRGSFTLPCTIDEMADMTKKALVGIVENVLVKIDKFIFSLDFVVIDMLRDRNETMILGRPFLATIHAQINVFNGEKSLGIREDRVTIDVSQLKSNNFDNQNNNDTPINDDMHEQCNKKVRIIKPDTNILNADFCKPIKQECDGTFKVWRTCDPAMKLCNGGNEIYEVDEQGTMKYWYYYLDDKRRNMGGKGLSFLDFLLVRYGTSKVDDSTWDSMYAKWCNENSIPWTHKSTLAQGDVAIPHHQNDKSKPRPRDYPFKEWLLIKVRHTDEYCEKVQGDNDSCHDLGFEEDERYKNMIDIRDYDHHKGFAAALAILITGASQSRQHGMSKPARRGLTD
ncbi:reverse transcriptase domain-containing protein [Tanacetum coccineum]